jgi:hypothetical protein
MFGQPICRFILVPLVVFALSGCNSAHTLVRWDAKEYCPAPLTDPGRAATLSNKRFDKDTVGENGFDLKSVDGLDTSTTLARDQIAKLNPGEHRILVECMRISTPVIRLKFVAEPDVSYELNGRIEKDRVGVWVQEVASQKRVSGVAVAPIVQVSLPIFVGK